MTQPAPDEAPSAAEGASLLSLTRRPTCDWPRCGHPWAISANGGVTAFCWCHADDGVRPGG